MPVPSGLTGPVTCHQVATAAMIAAHQRGQPESVPAVQRVQVPRAAADDAEGRAYRVRNAHPGSGDGGDHPARQDHERVCRLRRPGDPAAA